jgi:hypothetical protein
MGDMDAHVRGSVVEAIGHTARLGTLTRRREMGPETAWLDMQGGCC